MKYIIILILKKIIILSFFYKLNNIFLLFIQVIFNTAI